MVKYFDKMVHLPYPESYQNIFKRNERESTGQLVSTKSTSQNNQTIIVRVEKEGFGEKAEECSRSFGNFPARVGKNPNKTRWVKE